MCINQSFALGNTYDAMTLLLEYSPANDEIYFLGSALKTKYIRSKMRHSSLTGSCDHVRCVQ